MDQEPGQPSHERSLTEKVVKELSRGKNYQINLEGLDCRSAIELRRLLRDLDDRAKTKFRYPDMNERIEKAIPGAGGRVVAPGVYAFKTAFSKEDTKPQD